MKKKALEKRVTLQYTSALYHSSISDTKSITHALKTVDNALYKSKKEGCNRVIEVS